MKAHELLADPASWIQGMYASDENGYWVSVKSDLAVKFCLVGALCRCYKDEHEACNKVRAAIKQELAYWNDRPERTHAEVIAVLKELDL